LSGFHHIDGLLDFGDGVMFQGSPTKKIKVMHDQKVGAGGFAIGLIVMLTTAFCIAELSFLLIIPALVIAETSAKFSMIIVAMAGKSAYRGMNTYFVNAMHGAQGFYRFLIALTASLLLAWAFLKTAGAIMVITGGLVGLGMTIISHRNFNGVTGDVFGATNEVTRMACLLVMLGMIGWV
jgi:adenosylcobinamide-GDP ribazoletransferase